MTSRDRRAVVWGLAIVALAVVSLRVVPWLAGQIERNREEAISDVGRLARMREEIAGAKALEDSAVAVRARMERLAGRLLVGEREAEAQADLRSRVEAAVSRNRVRLLRMESLPDSTAAGSLRRASVGVSIQSDNGGLLRFLAALAGDSAAVVARQVSVIAARPRAAAGPEVLDAEVVVGGWFAGGNAP